MSDKKDKNLIYTSVSRINMYDTCPQQYYYCYIDEERKYIETDIHRRGHFVHKVLDNWAKLLKEHKIEQDRKDLDPIKLLHEAYRYGRKSDKAVVLAKSSQDRYYEAKHCVELFGKHLKGLNSVPNILDSEKSIKFTVDDIVALEVIIDRIDRVDDKTLEVIDYKVTKWKQYLTSFQLLVYVLALMSERNDFENIKSKYVVLDFVNHCYDERPFVVSESSLTRTRNRLITVAKTIEDSKVTNTWKPKQSRLCKACSFFMRCRMDNQKYFNSW